MVSQAQECGQPPEDEEARDRISRIAHGQNSAHLDLRHLSSRTMGEYISLFLKPICLW
jgi:hypothetical protein